MKKVFSAMIITIILLSSAVFTAVASGNEISVYLDASKIEFDVRPQIINGRTMVPIRAIFEKMGASVNWDAATNSAICTKDNITVKMTINNTEMHINDQVVKMDTSPVVINGRTLAPARYVAEAFGADVQWSQKNNTVVICSEDVYAYADYPDIPDLGRCYNISLLNSNNDDGYTVLTYKYSDFSNDERYSYLYDNSALILGNYKEESIDYTDGILTIAYTKPGELTPRYYVGVSYDEDGSMIFVVMIPNPIVSESKVTLYAPDGRTIEVWESEVNSYLNVGWYTSPPENKVTLYAPDGRTIEVWESEVNSYLNVGWYTSPPENKITLYAPDGRTIEVWESEVNSYLNVGWYSSYYEAQSANKPANDYTTSNNASANGNYYRTPTGKRYHLDPNCGGKNSYPTTNISGLSPCSKCAR